MLIHSGLDATVVKNLQRSKPKFGGTRIAGEYINSTCDSQEPYRQLPMEFEYDAQAVPCLGVVLLRKLHVHCRSSKNVTIEGIAAALKP